MQYGEIVQLGRHRLMRGDATKYEDIEALIDGHKVDLVLTDPPYGIRLIDRRKGSIGGSGTTLLACALTGRTCLMMEISPDYCDIIKDRYDNLKAQGGLMQ